MIDEPRLENIAQILSGNDKGFGAALAEFINNPTPGKFLMVKSLAKKTEEKEKLMLAAIPAAGKDSNIMRDVSYYFGINGRADKLLELAKSYNKAESSIAVLDVLASNLYICVYYLDHKKWKQLNVDDLKAALEIVWDVLNAKNIDISNNYHFRICNEILMFIYAFEGQEAKAKSLSKAAALQKPAMMFIDRAPYLFAAYMKAHPDITDMQAINRLENAFSLWQGRYPESFKGEDVVFLIGTRVAGMFLGRGQGSFDKRMKGLGTKISEDNYEIMSEEFKRHPTARGFHIIYNYLYSKNPWKPVEAMNFVEKCKKIAPNDQDFHVAVCGGYSHRRTNKQWLEYAMKCNEKWPNNIRFIDYIGDATAGLQGPAAAAEAVKIRIKTFMENDTKKRRQLFGMVAEFYTKAAEYKKGYGVL